jgi:hypothetical protein
VDEKYKKTGGAVWVGEILSAGIPESAGIKIVID